MEEIKLLGKLFRSCEGVLPILENESCLSLLRIKLGRKATSLLLVGKLKPYKCQDVFLIFLK